MNCEQCIESLRGKENPRVGWGGFKSLCFYCANDGHQPVVIKEEKQFIKPPKDLFPIVK